MRRQQISLKRHQFKISKKNKDLPFQIQLKFSNLISKYPKIMMKRSSIQKFRKHFKCKQLNLNFRINCKNIALLTFYR